MRHLLAALIVFASPLAYADAFPVGPGAQFVPRTTAPTKRTANASLYAKSNDSNKLHYVLPDGTDAALGAGVTSVSGPAEMTIANPTTTPAITWTSQAANKFLASPSGGSGAPIMRVLDNVDLTSNTNAVLDTDWFISPVDEMANGLHDGVYASFANHTCGVRFFTNQSVTVTGVRMFCPGTSAKTVKTSLWNKAGTRLANANISCGSGTSTSTSTFGTPQVLTAHRVYYVSGWITDGSLGLGYGVANTDLAITDSQVNVKWPGSAQIFWSGWGMDSAGDTFPNGDNSNVICQFDPVYTVP